MTVCIIGNTNSVITLSRPMKNDFLQVRITDEEKAELAVLVEKMADPEMNVSRFVRDAMREKVSRVRRQIARKETTEPATV